MFESFESVIAADPTAAWSSSRCWIDIGSCWLPTTNSFRNLVKSTLQYDSGTIVRGAKSAAKFPRPIGSHKILSFVDTDNIRRELEIMNFDNSDVVPENIEQDGTVHRTFDCRQIHHSDDRFPLVAPDMFFDFKTGTEKVKKNANGADYILIKDESVARQKFKSLMRANMSSPSNLWQGGRRHYVRGAIHREVENKFYVLPMDQPEFSKSTGWTCRKYRLRVHVQDETGKTATTTFVDCQHSPLKQLSNGTGRGLGGKLRAAFGHRTDDCRDGLNPGSMAAAGVRLMGGKLIPYAKTTRDVDQLNKLMTSAEMYFNRYNFGKWIMNLRNRMASFGLNGRTMMVDGDVVVGGTCPWSTLCVTTSNYGNEAHLDLADHCQGITIWHEKNPRMRKGVLKKNIENWYFLFPDMQIMVDGVWHNGVAVPLQHGTIVTWDATLVRHCTAFPTVIDPEKNAAFGTYFGVQRKVAMHTARETAKEKNERMMGRKRPRAANEPTDMHSPDDRKDKMKMKQETASAII